MKAVENAAYKYRSWTEQHGSFSQLSKNNSINAATEGQQV
jgi:hypothetical protein